MIVGMEDLMDKFYKIERRKYPRLNAFITYSVVDPANADKTANTKNISAGGIAFFAREKIELNTTLSLNINLPDRSDLVAKGRVVWVEKTKVPADPKICYELGIKFMEIDDNDRQRISRYIFYRLDKS